MGTITHPETFKPLNPSTTLVFEPLSGGHRAAFIRWLADAAPAYARLRFIFFTDKEVPEPMRQQLVEAGWWQKQRLLYRLFREACRIHQPDQVLILELTQLELPLLLFGSPVPLSAILFVQYPELSGFPKNRWVQALPASNAWKKVSKHWKTRLLLARVQFKNLFLLNGEKACRFLSTHFGAHTRFIPIPDPAPVAKPDPGFVMRDAYAIPADHKVFLFFGAISRRKGADVLIEALNQLDPDTAGRSTFVFCGEPEPPYKNDFRKAVAGVQGVETRVEDRFVSDEQMMALFAQCDVVLMPYTRPEYSSGILALAAKSGKPVLGPEGGLLGRLITENGLGATTPVTPGALAEALARPVSADKAKQQTFAANSSPDLFANSILTAVTESI